MKYRHGGNLADLAATAGRRVEDILDFSANINPLGPPEWLRSVISRQVERLVHYPDGDAAALRQAIATRHGVSVDRVVVANGSTEIIYALPRVMGLARALIPVPSYYDYTRASEMAGLLIELAPLRKADGFAIDWMALASRLRGGEMVWLARPNNPTGVAFEAPKFAEMAKAHSASVFVVDESFADFLSDGATLAKLPLNNVIVIKSLTKFYAIPGLRLGCTLADERTAQRIREGIGPWSVNTFAQAVGQAAMGDEEYARQTRRLVDEQRKYLATGLEQIRSLRVYPGTANFLLVEALGTEATTLACRLLMEWGIAVRVCDNFAGLDGQFIRVAVRMGEENSRLLTALQAILKGRSASAPRKKHVLMFQGTGSHAGKSLLATALCRILLQDGVQVAPFKAQNMSLNSFVTGDGGEMSRAQVVQAQACRLEPDVRMNPILLKPNSDTGSQVILRGRPVGHMGYADYMNFKLKIFDEVTACYDSLAAEYDAVVLEGAGSPAEVNFKRHEIVNMRMARHAEAPVLLVGDIDRGGVLAAFVGTLELLDAEERRRIAGFVINNFRGSEALLQPAIDYVLAHTGKATFGVVPFIPDLNLPEEDSLDWRRRSTDNGAAAKERIDVAVIDLPRISNFTDFDALRGEPDVGLRFVRKAEDLGEPDAVILPGSKNTIADLQHLRSNGLADRIRGLAGRVPIVGICAGFQMLGRKIDDPHHIETTAGSTDGLGLLGVTTILAPEKTLLRTRAKHLPSGLDVQGYEVHHGLSNMDGAAPFLQRQDGVIIGVSGREELIWGTYLHGVFDADPFRRWFIDHLRVRRGLSAIGRVCAPYDLEVVFDRLADIVRSHLDLKKIYQLMGL